MSDIAKLIMAFFVGIAIALGCVFVFMRSSAPPHELVAAGAPAEGPVAPMAGPAEAVRQVAEPEPERRVAPKPVKAKAKRQKAPEPVDTPAPAPAKAPDREPAPAASSFAPPPAPAYTPPPAPVPPKQQPHTVTLPAGTALSVRLNETVSTERNSSGDSFRATLVAPVVVDGFVIADRGSKVQGQVVEADRSGRVKGRANLSLALTEINTTDGQRVRVQTNSVIREASASKGSDTAKIAAGSAIGALIGGLTGGGKGAAIGAGAGGAAGTGVVLGTRGKDVMLPNETALTFKLVSPVTITEQFHN